MLIKLSTFFLMLTLCSPALADPIVYVCERPAWEGEKGCGPNNTYYTYAFHVETDDLLLTKDDPKYKRPTYAFQMSKSCDVSRGSRRGYFFSVAEESLTFWVNLNPAGASYAGSWSKVKLDRENMTAVMDGVKKSPFLNCRKEESESWIITQAKSGGGVRGGQVDYYRTFPTEEG